MEQIFPWTREPFNSVDEIDNITVIIHHSRAGVRTRTMHHVMLLLSLHIYVLQK